MSAPERLSRRTLLAAPALWFVGCRHQRPSPVATDLPYGPSSSQRLDLYPAAVQDPGRRAPLAVLIHGGGWEKGSRDDVVHVIANLTSRGYAVANVGYRLAAEARAPGAAEDVRHAIEYARSRAKDWNADGGRMLLVGFSAGAHLALLSSLAPSGVLDGPQSHPRAIVSFWGITDLADLLDGPNAKNFARNWVAGSVRDRGFVAALSPVTYDAAEAPALCAVHSVHDDVVPYAHSETLVRKFHEAKRPATVIRRFHQGHAAPSTDYAALFDGIFRFLDHAKVVE